MRTSNSDAALRARIDSFTADLTSIVRGAVLGSGATAAVLLICDSAVAQQLDWQIQIGSPESDTVHAIASDAGGGTFVTGGTFGSVAGPSSGNYDAFLARFDRNGQQLWAEQFGTAGYDDARAVAADGNGGCLVAGPTSSQFGGINLGGWDAWAAQYDSTGVRLWIRQLGTPADDECRAAAVDELGRVVIGGSTRGGFLVPNAGGTDAWIAQLGAAGHINWIQQLGTGWDEQARGITALQGGGFAIVGETRGVLGAASAGGIDVWVAKYSAGGSQLWIRQLGTTFTDIAAGCASDGVGGVVVCGYTEGSLGGPSSGGSDDVWVARFDGNGAILWIRQFGTPTTDHATAITADGVSGAVVTGYTLGNLASPNSGSLDAWTARFDGSGTQLWTRQFGTALDERLYGAATDGIGGCVVGGFRSSSSDSNGLVARYTLSSTTSTYCTAGTTSSGCVPSIAGSGVAQASANAGFVLTSVQVEGNRSGLFFYGVNGRVGSPWGAGGSSYFCVKTPVQRMSALTTGGTSGACDGTLSQDWRSYVHSHPTALGQPFSAGDSVWAQAWFRDPPASKTTSLTDALEFTLLP